jgi:GT2 family glycosyltransferase
MTDTDAPPITSGPAVSVVLPAYNRATTIRTAIDSVLAQSFTDLELIVVDDHSTDGTVTAVRTVTDPRLRLIESPANAGAAAARNRGIAVARAPWVAFQDSDDEWLTGKLALQMARLTAPGADFVAAYCGMIVIGTPDPDPARAETRPQIRYVPPENIPGPALEGAILPMLLHNCVISTQMLVARRDVLQAVGGFDESLSILIDWECAIRLAEAGPIAFIDEPLVIQRFSPNSISRDANLRATTRMAIVAKHHNLFERNPEAFAQRWYEEAGALRAQGETKAARAALRRSIRLNPRRWRPWAALAWLSLRAPFGR